MPPASKRPISQDSRDYLLWCISAFMGWQAKGGATWLGPNTRVSQLQIATGAASVLMRSASLTRSDLAPLNEATVENKAARRCKDVHLVDISAL